MPGYQPQSRTVVRHGVTLTLSASGAAMRVSKSTPDGCDARISTRHVYAMLHERSGDNFVLHNPHRVNGFWHADHDVEPTMEQTPRVECSFAALKAIGARVAVVRVAD